MKRITDPQEALSEYFIELYVNDNIVGAKRRFRRLLWLMVKHRMSPGDLEMTDSEMSFHAQQVQLSFPEVFRRFKEVFENITSP